jgi:GNAT superfamily N-acetyltransferase
MQSDGATAVKGLNVAPLKEGDLPEAEQIFRVAFGTFLGEPDPSMFWADRDYVYGRHRAPHVAALGATLDGSLVGSNFVFGPITVRPDLQERGIAQALLAKTMEQFDAWERGMLGCLPFRIARNTSVSIKNMVFTPDFLQQSCQRPWTADQARPLGGLVSAT